MSKKNLIIFLILFLLIIITAGIMLFFERKKQAEIKPKVYTVGLLQMAPTVAENMEGFKQGMAELGYKEGVDINYIYRDAEGDLPKLDQYAKELVLKKPDLIFVNTSPATEKIKKLTENTDIPVVFSMVADPLRAGFVKSRQSSGNNLTGTSCDYIDIAPKRLEILKEVNSKIKKVLIFYRPQDLSGGPATERILEKAQAIGLEVTAVSIEKKDDIRQYLENLSPGQFDAIMDPADSMVTAGLTEWGIKKAKELKIVLMMLSKGECEKGALVCYGVDYIDLGKQNSFLANQILRGGVHPSNIPIESPRKFSLVINLKTANEIGFQVSENILNKANYIIE